MRASQRERGPGALLRRMWSAAVVGGLALAGGDEARADLLVYEPFDYAESTVLDDTPATGQNLAGSYTALGTLPQQQLTVTSPGVGYGSLEGVPGASGGRASDVLGVTPAGASVSLAQPVSVDPGQTLYWSVLLTLDDGLNGNHLANLTLNDDATGDALFFGEPAVGVGGLRLAAIAQGAIVASDTADGAFTDGHTLLLVGRYLNSAAPGGDVLDLLSYDTADAVALPSFFDPADPNAGNAYHVSGVDIDLARITSLTFTIRGLDNNFIDELRIGTRYGSVIPEPATAALLALGLATLGAMRRSRTRGARR